MTLFTAIPKSLKKFKKKRKYNSKNEASIGFHHYPGKLEHDYITISVFKQTGVYGLKISFEHDVQQKEADHAASMILNKLGSYADWAREGAVSGGTLYRIWGRHVAILGKKHPLHPKPQQNAKIEAALKSIVIACDKIAR